MADGERLRHRGHKGSELHLTHRPHLNGDGDTLRAVGDSIDVKNSGGIAGLAALAGLARSKGLEGYVTAALHLEQSGLLLVLKGIKAVLGGSLGLLDEDGVSLLELPVERESLG
jgi:hypothetical protein